MNRRSFLKRTAAAGAAVAFPTIIPASALGQDGRTPPSDRVTLALLGCGNRGGSFRGWGSWELVMACDPFPQRAKGRCPTNFCQDYREVMARPDIDAVILTTPDHWHVPLAVAAIRSGKDVYCEKPLGTCMEDHKYLRALARQRRAVFQYGTQQRSGSRHCGHAAELVRNGVIGELRKIHVTSPNGKTGGDPTPAKIPDGFDYDLWLGPSPWCPYCSDRVGRARGHRFIHAHCVGYMGGWGAHPLDIAHWGYPHVPVEWEGKGTIPTRGLYDTVVNWDIRATYAGGAKFTWRPGGDSTTFVGTEGTIRASRGGASAEPASLLTRRRRANELRLLQPEGNHLENFINCVRQRRTPASDLDSAVQSDFMTHLGSIACRVGRPIRWDPEKEEIVGDAEARRWGFRTAREPYGVRSV